MPKPHVRVVLLMVALPKPLPASIPVGTEVAEVNTYVFPTVRGGGGDGQPASDSVIVWESLNQRRLQPALGYSASATASAGSPSGAEFQVGSLPP